MTDEPKGKIIVAFHGGPDRIIGPLIEELAVVMELVSVMRAAYTQLGNQGAIDDLNQTYWTLGTLREMVEEDDSEDVWKERKKRAEKRIIDIMTDNAEQVFEGIQSDDEIDAVIKMLLDESSGMNRIPSA